RHFPESCDKHHNQCGVGKRNCTDRERRERNLQRRRRRLHSLPGRLAHAELCLLWLDEPAFPERPREHGRLTYRPVVQEPERESLVLRLRDLRRRRAARESCYCSLPPATALVSGLLGLLSLRNYATKVDSSVSLLRPPQPGLCGVG